MVKAFNEVYEATANRKRIDLHIEDLAAIMLEDLNDKEEIEVNRNAFVSQIETETASTSNVRTSIPDFFTRLNREDALKLALT